MFSFGLTKILFQKITIRNLTILSLLVSFLLGLLTKFYTGPAQFLVNNYVSSIPYETCWCLLFFWLIPTRKAVQQIPIWVFIVTCILEFLQLWHPPFLELLRANLLGKLILGSQFDPWDFIAYVIGSFLGWLWLRQIWQIGYEKTSQG